VSTSQPGPPASGETGLVRLRLDLAYEGTNFAGWAVQPGQRTAQGELTAALERVLRLDEVRLIVAGRTDAGVHARGQVVHLDVPRAAWDSLPGRSAGRAAPDQALLRRLAGVLEPDLVVHRAAPAPAGFDARFSALWRRYAYRVADSEAVRDPATRAHVLWLRARRPLDVELMTAAMTPLLGEHDFLPFCRPKAAGTTIRTLQSLRWQRDTGGLAVLHVRADAFCHRMVRSLVGASLAVGEGVRASTWPADLLAAGKRDGAVQVAPARGLTLEEVGYPADTELAERARVSRAVRVPLLSRAPDHGGRVGP